MKIRGKRDSYNLGPIRSGLRLTSVTLVLWERKR